MMMHGFANPKFIVTHLFNHPKYWARDQNFMGNVIILTVLGFPQISKVNKRVDAS
jgi:hypothetical protein